MPRLPQEGARGHHRRGVVQNGTVPHGPGTKHQGSPPWLRAARQLVSMFPYIAAAVLYL